MELLRTQEVSEGPVPPLDHPQAVEEWGVTAWEERLGEPLNLRLHREKPDVFDAVEEEVRPVFQPGAEYWIDDEPAEVGDLDSRWEDSLSAEEAAMRIDEEPPGITYDDSPGYRRPAPQ